MISGRYSYLPVHAEGCYRERRQRQAILERDAKLGRFARERLLEGWTPERIAGWLKRGEGRGLGRVSAETIYSFVHRPGQKGEKLCKLLPRGRARRGRRRARPPRSTIAGRRSIHDRPEAVQARGSPALCVDQAARSMRRRSRSRPARPYICRFSSLSRVIRPSVWPLLQGVVSAARTAAPSCSRPGAKVSPAGTPPARASRSQASRASGGASGRSRLPTQQARTSSVKRRAEAATIAASPSCITRATVAASAADSRAAGRTSSQASSLGEGSAAGPPSPGGRRGARPPGAPPGRRALR